MNDRIDRMEELLPIVAKLVDLYTSKQSTSVSYEKAQQLMEAVLYCIKQCNEEYQLTCKNQASAMELYECGYEKLIQKVKKTQLAYNEMIVDFCAYGNMNYDDTVTKAISGFFTYYDVRFAPQETIITMDYPTICPIVNCSGINAIAKYIEYISYEQKFLKALPQEYVCDVLFRYQVGYRKQFYNICNIVLRHVLIHMMLGKGLGNKGSQEEYAHLTEMILKHEKEWIKNQLVNCLRKLIQEKYNNDEQMEHYLSMGLHDFVTELYVGAQNGRLTKVVVI